MPDTQFHTPRGTAADVVLRLSKALVTAIPAAVVQGGQCHTNLLNDHLKIQPGPVSTSLGKHSNAPPEALTRFEFLYIRNLNIHFTGLGGPSDPNASLHIDYQESPNDLSARITISATERWQPDALERVLQSLSQHFPFRRFDVLALEANSEANREALRAYENSLAFLGTNVSQLGTFLTQQEQKLASFLLEKATELDKQYSERVTKLEAQIADRTQILDEEAKKLKRREEEIDARDRTTTRRDLLKTIRGILDLQKDARLSKATASKRAVITTTCILAMLFGAAIGGRAAWVITERGFEWSHGIPMTTGLLLFASTLVFFLRWNDAWFRDHARAEFQALRNHADILRASWIAELYFEWAETKDNEFPPALAERLSQNLFADVSKDTIEHPVEQIAKVLKQVQLKAGTLELNTKPSK